jgi:hypothetical protein
MNYIIHPQNVKAYPTFFSNFSAFHSGATPQAGKAE